MPSYFTYKKNMSGITNGKAHKLESDMVMEHTWDNDISARDMYFYDWYHDSNKTVLTELNPVNDVNKIKMNCKFMSFSTQTYDKDTVTFHLQMKPSQQCIVPYYNEMFKNRYEADYPVGLYVDIQNSQDIWNRWLVVAGSNINDAQFPTFELLRCNKVLQYILDGVKYNVPVVLRNQNSYNSGIWTDNHITSPEDQVKFIAPMNRDTEKLYYNQRLIIDSPVLTEPRTWKISKVNRLTSKGVVQITATQDAYDEHKDYIELDDNGNVIGMWADYFASEILPGEIETDTTQLTRCDVSYAGLKPEIKIGGSYKKLSVDFSKDGVAMPFEQGIWSFTMNGIDVSNLLTIKDYISDSKLNENEIKIKFNGDRDYLHNILNVRYVSNSGITNDVDLEISEV